MPPQPTKEQLDSRNEVQNFLERAHSNLRKAANNIKSSWFGRPDEELKAWVDRGRAWEAVKDSEWYRLQSLTVEKEIQWAQTQLELGELDAAELRAYLKALRFVKAYIITVEQNMETSLKVLEGRSSEINKVVFMKGAQNDRSK